MNWMYYAGVYIGVGILVSLYAPMRVGRTLETLEEAPSVTRVIGGLLWPLYVAAWVASQIYVRFM